MQLTTSWQVIRTRPCRAAPWEWWLSPEEQAEFERLRLAGETEQRWRRVADGEATVVRDRKAAEAARKRAEAERVRMQGVGA